MYRSASQGAKPDPWCPDGLEWYRAILLGLTFIVVAITSEVILFYSEGNSGNIVQSYVRSMRLNQFPQVLTWISSTAQNSSSSR